jgi:hypothetical protein
MKNTIIIALLVFSACNRERAADSGEIVEIRITPDHTGQTDILQLIEDIELIPLETNDNSLIGNINRVKTDEKHIYVLDYNESLNMFSKDGKFISQIGHKGQGPGEYLQISDFLPDRDTVHVFTWYGYGKWIRYSGSNRFLYETDITFPFEEICPLDGNRYLTYVSNGTVSEECAYYLYCVDTDFKIQSRIELKTPPSDIPLHISQNHFLQNSGRLLYRREYCDTVYTISRDLEIRPAYRLDFGKHWYSRQFMETYHDKTVFEIYDAVNRNKYAKFIYLRGNDTHLIIAYAIQDDKDAKKYCNYLAVYNKKTGATYNFKESSGDLWADLMIHPYCVQGNQFVSLISAEILMEIASKMDGGDIFSEKVKKCAEQMDESDNPVMVRFVLK